MARKNDYLVKVDKIIGEKICSLRLAKGLSRTQVAEAIGVAHQQLQKYEKGADRIAVGRLLLISKALGKEIRFFLENIQGDEGIEVTSTKHQRMCVEVSTNFMRLKNPKHQEIINSLVRSLIREG